MILFIVYCLVYERFVFINALMPDAMDIQPIEGINLAIVYGFALIVGAFVLAIVYGMLCRDESEAKSDEESSK